MKRGKPMNKATNAPSKEAQISALLLAHKFRRRKLRERKPPSDSSQLRDSAKGVRERDVSGELS